MDEYIKREEAVDAVLDAYFNTPKINLIGKLFYNAILELQPADVAPVRHGKWMPFHAEFAGDIQYCSVCEIGFAYRTSYCPHCGARMDGNKK